jgi:hypothetical protein
MNRFDIVIFDTESSRINSIARRSVREDEWERMEREIRGCLREGFTCFTVPAGEYMKGDFLSIPKPN